MAARDSPRRSSVPSLLATSRSFTNASHAAPSPDLLAQSR